MTRLEAIDKLCESYSVYFDVERFEENEDLLAATCFLYVHSEKYVLVKNNSAQSLTRDAKQRRENVAGVYALCGQTDVSGLRILLVDDVVTTGATMSEAARILRKAGAKAVYGAALARHED